MPTQFYIRNGIKALPAEKQRALAPAGAVIYEDAVPRTRLRDRDPELLTQRAYMLLPTSREDNDEVICVASVVVLGVGLRDAIRALRAVHERGGTLKALDTGSEFPKGMGEALWDAFADEYEKRGRSMQTADAWPAGVTAAAAAAKARTKEGVEKARLMWNDPDDARTNQEIAEEVGLGASTLSRELGSRRRAKIRMKNRRKRRGE